MRKVMKLGIIFILCSSVLNGCAKINTISNNYSEKNSIVYSLEEIPNSLIANNDLSRRENDLICSVFEGLVEITDSGNVIPALAEGWKITSDSIGYIFELKDDIKWSDGTQITSFDFIDYFKSILSPENNITDELDIIYGIKDYREGRGTFDNVAIKAIDNSTISIRLNNKDDNFLYKLSKPLYRLRDTKNLLSDYKNQYSNIRYSGPYTITDVDDNGNVTITKNKYYKGDFTGINQITFKEKKANEIEFALYNMGSIDILSNPPITLLDEGNLYKYISRYVTDNIKFLLFNTKNSVIELPHFREGIYNALNIEILNNYLIKNNVSTWNVSMINYPELVDGDIDNNIEFIYDENQNLIYANKATELFSKIDLREKKLNIITANTEENKLVGEFIGNLLKDKYYIKSKLTLCNSDDLEKFLEENNFDIYIMDIDINNISENIKFLKERVNLFNKDNAIISLMNRNDIWCKSDLIKYLFIDSNGNLIFKYIEKF